MQPTFLRLFADDDSRVTEYLAIASITRVRVEPVHKERAQDPDESRVVISFRESSDSTPTQITVTGPEVPQLLETLNSLAPAQ
jgi:hypothetical protein